MNHSLPRDSSDILHKANDMESKDISIIAPTDILFNLESSDSTQHISHTDNLLIRQVEDVEDKNKSKCQRYQSGLFNTASQGFGDLKSDESLRSINRTNQRSLKMRQTKMKNSIRKELSSAPYKSKSNDNRNSNIDDIISNFSSSLSSTK